MATKRNKKKLVLIGWDAADWKIISPLMKAGKMPALKRLMSEGVSGNLATIEPALSPMLWTSIATGKYPDKHGILGFTEPNPQTGAPRPVSSTSRKVKAIWNILTQQEYKTQVFAWWPSHPAEPINGICVSNFYQRADQPISKPWPMPSGTVHPEKYAGIFKNLRIHPDELTEAHVLPFIPNAGKVDQEKDTLIGVFSKILADCATVHSASTWALENEDWDFHAVYYDAIDHFCHGFMKFHPPHRPGLPEELFETYKDVVNGAYMFHDMMLERTLELAGPDAHVILISDHGFQSDHLRPASIPKEPAGPAYEHRPYGIICMKGPEFKKNESIYGSCLLDITPTILTLLDLPVGKDMDGVPLLQAFSGKKEIREIESWEQVKGDFGMHDETFIEDPYAAKQALDQLIELGYVEEMDENPKQRIKQVETESKFNLARVYIGSNRYQLAIPILEALNKQEAQERYLIRLIHSYKGIGEYGTCEKLIRDLRKMNDKNQNDLFIDVLEASVLVSREKHREALDLLNKAQKATTSYSNFHLLVGQCYLGLKEWKQAQTAYVKALIIDKDKASAHYGFGLSLLRQQKYEEAAGAFLNAIGLIYQYPVAHYHLGETLYHMGAFQPAADAFEVAVAMNPGISRAAKWLEKIYTEHPEVQKISFQRQVSKTEDLDREVSAQVKKPNFKSFAGKLKGEVIIVSGLPRSGTSMMMQMLEKGGIPIFTDKERKADESNPKGYYEHEAIKSTIKNKSWLKHSVDRAAKVISHLLVHLPPTYRYKVIFMRRDINEIVVSQHKMLVKGGKAKAGTYPAGVEMTFRKNLAKTEKWIEDSENVDVLYVDYADVIDQPEKCAAKIAAFLGQKPDIGAMTSAIDQALYRNKIGRNVTE